MKRFLALAFVLVTVATLAGTAVAENVDESFYVGVWVYNERHATNDGETTTVLHLTEDHKTYFLIQSFKDDGSPDSGRTAVKSWSASGNKIHVIIGENTYLDLQVKDQDTLQDAGIRKQDLYHRVSGEAFSNARNLESGMILDPGHYSIGIDIPAGDYRFEYYQKPADVFVYNDANSFMWSDYFSLIKESPVFAKINLPEGARLDIVSYPVIIMRAKPLNLGE